MCVPAVALSLLVFAPFGIVSGLIVFMIPPAILFLQGAVAMLLVALCMWARWPMAARLMGSITLVAPAGYCIFRYYVERAFCRTEPDPAACLSYLNGASLLPTLVIIYAVLSVAAFVGFWPLLRSLERRISTRV